MKEENISVGKNPLFVDENAGDFSLQNGSPAIANGYNSEQPDFDFNGAPFDTPRSTGAFEKTKFTGFQDWNQKIPDEMKIFPNQIETD